MFLYLVKTPKATDIDPSLCKDVDSEATCDYFKNSQYGPCDNPNWIGYFKDKCLKSCNFC